MADTAKQYRCNAGGAVMDTTVQICTPVTDSLMVTNGSFDPPVTVIRNGYQRFTLNPWYPLADGYPVVSTGLMVTVSGDCHG